MPSQSGKRAAGQRTGEKPHDVSAVIRPTVAMFGALLEAMPDAVVGVDRSGVIRFVNHQAEALFGYERGGLAGSPLETLVPESFRSVHQAQREGYFAAPRTRPMGTDVELTGRRREGTRFPADIALSHIDTDEGPLVIAAVRDMTRHRQAEEERRRTDLLLAIVEHSDDPIIGTSLEGNITSWNPAAERVFGYSSAEIMGKPIKLISRSERADPMATILPKVKAGQRIEPFDAVRVRKDGAAVRVALTISPIRDAGGEIIGVSTIAHDVTKERQAFEAARSMIESSLDALVALSPEGKITDANLATVRLTGIPRDQLIGTDFSRYFTDPERAEEIYRAVLADGIAVDYPLTLRHRNGHETLTEVMYNASVYRDAEGNVLGVFAAARDVTGQRQAEAEAAREHNRALERLSELERSHRLMVMRELKMIELKKSIERFVLLYPADREDWEQG